MNFQSSILVPLCSRFPLLALAIGIGAIGVAAAGCGTQIHVCGETPGQCGALSACVAGRCEVNPPKLIATAGGSTSGPRPRLESAERRMVAPHEWAVLGASGTQRWPSVIHLRAGALALFRFHVAALGANDEVAEAYIALRLLEDSQALSSASLGRASAGGKTAPAETPPLPEAATHAALEVSTFPPALGLLMTASGVSSFWSGRSAEATDPPRLLLPFGDVARLSSGGPAWVRVSVLALVTSWGKSDARDRDVALSITGDDALAFDTAVGPADNVSAWLELYVTKKRTSHRE